MLLVVSPIGASNYDLQGGKRNCAILLSCFCKSTSFSTADQTLLLNVHSALSICVFLGLVLPRERTFRHNFPEESIKTRLMGVKSTGVFQGRFLE